jgi:hypothetical protein
MLKQKNLKTKRIIKSRGWMSLQMSDVFIFLASVPSSLFVALLAVWFDRRIGDKKELDSVISALGFEIVENISIAKTITEKAENEIKTFQTNQISFAPMPTFSNIAYFRAKNTGCFLDFVNKNKSGVEKELIEGLQVCYNAQGLKLELIMQRGSKEKGEQISTNIIKTIQEVIEPSLTKMALLILKIDPKLHKTMSPLSEPQSN